LAALAILDALKIDLDGGHGDVHASVDDVSAEPYGVDRVGEWPAEDGQELFIALDSRLIAFTRPHRDVLGDSRLDALRQIRRHQPHAMTR
jgi:hypothetical protein